MVPDIFGTPEEKPNENAKLAMHLHGDEYVDCVREQLGESYASKQPARQSVHA